MELLANIDVPDLQAGIAFYTSALGLRVGRRFGTFGAELLGASSAIYLLEKPAGSAPAPRAHQIRDYSRHWTPVHLDFVVADIEAAVRRAVAAGASPEGEMRTHLWGHIAVFADPFGHGFCLIQFRNRGYDEIADGSGDG
jgi:catechol 2,3-dioxygenase-like lactoylglutathione lyase family enzyme